MEKSWDTAWEKYEAARDRLLRAQRKINSAYRAANRDYKEMNILGAARDLAYQSLVEARAEWDKTRSQQQ